MSDFGLLLFSCPGGCSPNSPYYPSNPLLLGRDEFRNALLNPIDCIRDSLFEVLDATDIKAEAKLQDRLVASFSVVVSFLVRASAALANACVEPCLVQDRRDTVRVEDSSPVTKSLRYTLVE